MSHQETSQSSPDQQIQNTHRQLLALNHAREGETEQLLEMILSGLPVDSADGSQNTLLLLACYYGHVKTARMLILHGANIEKRNIRGQTPLGGVAFKGYDDVAALLLEHGADPHADSGGGATPAMFAAMFERKKMLELFAATSGTPA
jgi:uncharacterized protein